jgi:WD40 repeat protein
MLDGVPVFATSSDKGDVYIWDLSKKRLSKSLIALHDMAITSLSFLHGQPILLSAAGDNSLKVDKSFIKAYYRNGYLTRLTVIPDY